MMEATAKPPIDQVTIHQYTIFSRTRERTSTTVHDGEDFISKAIQNESAEGEGDINQKLLPALCFEGLDNQQMIN